ncbi:hypothetical protein HOY80DRAFT_1043994 [Tuber brumale]|nr:hypothetical protein HOY80DRAFT_1043994 [Tuber brumale]
MVFKHNFSFSPRQPVLSRPSSRSSLASSHAGGLRNPDDGEVSPSSKGPSFMSSWGSKRSSVTSFASSFRRRRYKEAPTTSPVDDGEGPEGEIALSRDSVKVVPTISVGDFGEDEQNGFSGQDDIQKDIGIGLPTPFGPLDRTAIDISFGSTHKETLETLPAETSLKKPLAFATLHAPFPFIQPIAAQKSAKSNRRPAMLNIQIPPPLPSSYTIQRNQISPSELADSPLQIKGSKGVEQIGLRLLLRTLSPGSEGDEGTNDNTMLGHKNTRAEELQSYLEEPTPVYLSSPWFPPTQRKSIAFEDPIMESNPRPRRPSIKIEPSAKLETPPSPVISPSSIGTSGSPALFRSYLGVPSVSHTQRPSTPSSTRSFLLEDDDDNNDEAENREVAGEEQPISRRGSLSPSSRRSSINTFFCRGSRTSFSGASNRWSIGLGSIADADIVIKDDEDLTGYPGIDELKKQISWLCTNPPEHSSPLSDGEGDDEDRVDSESEGEGSYHKHLTLVTKMSSRSLGSKFGSAGSMTPELVSSVSDSSSGPVSTPPPRRNRRRTASSECIVLEALQEMHLAGMRAELELPAPMMKGLKISGEVEVRGGGSWSEIFLDLEDESRW